MPAADADLPAVARRTGREMPFTYDPALVAASVLLAVMASFTGLRLASGLKSLSPAARKLQIAKAAFALGGGIWSMHFVGMLAVELPVRITYDALFTLGSVLISILITGLGLSLMHIGERRHLRTALAGTLTGLGIVSMHYVGMAAIGGNCRVSYLPGGAWLSSGIAVLFSIGALGLAYHRRTLLEMSAAAVLLGFTISAMHYSAMAFTQFLAVGEIADIAVPVIQDGYLALFVACAAFVVCGVFLLTALPMERATATAARAPAQTHAEAPGQDTRRAPAPRHDTANGAVPESVPGALAASEAESRLRVPYEQNNTTYFVEADRISAIRAEGHYTRLYDGSETFFCPWSISKLESYLAGRSFMRTHRSYLVNLKHARAFRRRKDKAYLMVAGRPEPLVPVSRAHLGEVRRALGI